MAAKRRPKTPRTSHTRAATRTRTSGVSGCRCEGTGQWCGYHGAGACTCGATDCPCVYTGRPA